MPVSAALLPILASALVALGSSFVIALLLVITRRWHLPLTGDSQLGLPQKIHRENIPRVGGLAIVGGFVIGLVHLVWFGANPPAVSSSTALILLGGLAPIAIAGFGEDITKRITPAQRLGWMALGSIILLTTKQLWLDRLGVPWLDPIFANWGIAIAFSVFACMGATNAFNLIDGLNGLLAGVSLITLAAIAWVAATLGDQKVFALAILLGVAMIGWLPFNWPKARLFAGDGGAYSVGFLSAALMLLLIQRNPQVSPWFGLTAAALPIWETAYSIWRRTRSGMKTTEPDQSHLHQLVRSRLHWTLKSYALRRAAALPRPTAQTVAVKAPNGLCSPLLWSLHAMAVVAGAMNAESTLAQALVFAAFATTYIALHSHLLRFRAAFRDALAN